MFDNLAMLFFSSPIGDYSTSFVDGFLNRSHTPILRARRYVTHVLLRLSTYQPSFRSFSNAGL